MFLAIDFGGDLKQEWICAHLLTVSDIYQIVNQGTTAVKFELVDVVNAGIEEKERV